MTNVPWVIDVPLKESIPRICDYCLSLSEARQLTPVGEAMKFGYIMIVVGVVIGFLVPKAVVYVRRIMEKGAD